MRIKLYMDVFPGPGTLSYFATSTPTLKIAGCIRYAFEVEIPDPGEPDAVLPMPVVARKEPAP